MTSIRTAWLIILAVATLPACTGTARDRSSSRPVGSHRPPDLVRSAEEAVTSPSNEPEPPKPSVPKQLSYAKARALMVRMGYKLMSEGTNYKGSFHFEGVKDDQRARVELFVADTPKQASELHRDQEPDHVALRDGAYLITVQVKRVGSFDEQRSRSLFDALVEAALGDEPHTVVEVEPAAWLRFRIDEEDSKRRIAASQVAAIENVLRSMGHAVTPKTWDEEATFGFARVVLAERGGAFEAWMLCKELGTSPLAITDFARPNHAVFAHGQCVTFVKHKEGKEAAARVLRGLLTADAPKGVAVAANDASRDGTPTVAEIRGALKTLCEAVKVERARNDEMLKSIPIRRRIGSHLKKGNAENIINYAVGRLGPGKGNYEDFVAALDDRGVKGWSCPELAKLYEELAP